MLKETNHDRDSVITFLLFVFKLTYMKKKKTYVYPLLFVLVGDCEKRLLILPFDCDSL